MVTDPISSTPKQRRLSVHPVYQKLIATGPDYFFLSPLKFCIVLKAVFHVIATIATIATIAGIPGKKERKKQRSAIVLIKWQPQFSDRSDHNISERSLKIGFHVFAAISRTFFSSDHMETSFKQPFPY